MSDDARAAVLVDATVVRWALEREPRRRYNIALTDWRRFRPRLAPGDLDAMRERGRVLSEPLPDEVPNDDVAGDEERHELIGYLDLAREVWEARTKASN